MKTIISVLLFSLLVSGCAMTGGNNENKGDLKKSPCAMAIGDKQELVRCEIRHHAVTNSPEFKNG